MIQLLDQDSFLKTIKGLINRAILNTALIKKISKSEATIEIVNIINDYLDELLNETSKENNTNQKDILKQNLSYILNAVESESKISDLNKKMLKQNINNILQELKKD
ncbi:MAG: hypothetical protein IJ880_16435 [Bacilli bacterium]|nr:hypothetical protein [Bacilli bacterium]